MALGAWACGQSERAVLLGGGSGGTTYPIDEDEDGQIDLAPDPVNDIFTVEQLQDFRDAGLKIYLGDSPPDVEGSYLATTLVITYDSGGASAALAPYLFSFTGQDVDWTVELDYTSDAEDSSLGNLAYIAGEESCFSLFSEIKGFQAADDCHYVRPTVISGCMDGTRSVAGFSFGFILTEREGDCSQTMPLGHMRVIKETDGLATRH